MYMKMNLESRSQKSDGPRGPLTPAFAKGCGKASLYNLCADVRPMWPESTLSTPAKTPPPPTFFRGGHGGLPRGPRPNSKAIKGIQSQSRLSGKKITRGACLPALCPGVLVVYNFTHLPFWEDSSTAVSTRWFFKPSSKVGW